MVEQTSRQTGNIYDLGYRKYEGERLGRRFAILSLYTYSFRSIFGLGRSWLSKLFPIGLAIVALIPASIQLGIAAISPAEIEFIEPESYFEVVSIILALFCAVAAPEIIGRDQRTRTLSLYFSRALSRLDYAVAKLLALFLALFLVLFTPQIILILGRAVAATDFLPELQDNAELIPPIVGTSIIVAAVMSSVGLAVASQTSRRAFSTGAVLAYFVITTALGGILLETLTGTARDYAVVVSPILVNEGAVYWVFGTQPDPGGDLASIDLDPIVYFVASCVYCVIATAIFLRKIQRVSA